MSHIFLYGPPGTGKSTIGKTLARNLKLPFIDLDRVIETNAGMSIPQIMETQGETAFRDLETAALRELIFNPNSSFAGKGDSVIALGGGALLRDENREMAETNGKVVLLMAELNTLLERLNSDPNKRPLLAGDLSEKLASLLESRLEHYNSFPSRVQVDGKAAHQNTWQTQIAVGRYRLSAMSAYDAIVENHGLEQLSEMLKPRGLKKPIVVTDENVAVFHAEIVMMSLREGGLNPKLLAVPAGEANKTLNTVNRIWHGFLEAGLDRKSTVIALGGGVIGDMAGFAASTFMRGVSWVGVPTTLLSMVDASLGGKTGFDLPEGKNLIGAFHAPKLVLADPQVLKTLPEVELISGLAEVVKHGIISDPELFNLCARGLDWVKENLEEIVRRAMAVKIQVIEDDPYERGRRAVLNLGHTVGHAVELVSKFQLRHGEAVAMGMVAEAKLAERLTVAGKGLSEAIAESLSALGLPVQIPKELSREEIIHAMRVDKKKDMNVIRFALPAGIGKVELVDVADLEKVLE
ncbi:MAG: 3-dehydroquinate synthase [Chloroflexi bacterium]|nr:3-dehydroquinate synthase [Chloroflexota bacterium]